MNNIFVLGGTGFVGAHVCELLVRQGWHVTVPTRRMAHARGIALLPGLTPLELDVHDPAALTRALAGHDAVVNLVAILHGTQAAFQHVHVELPRTLARACAANQVQQVVHVSALGADTSQVQSAPSMYLRSKSQGEAVWQQATALHGLGVTLLRPSVIFGAEDKFLNLFAQLQRLLPVMLLAGADARFAPVWVQDVAAAVVAALKAPQPAGHCHAVQACGPDEYTLRALVQLARACSTGRAQSDRPVIGLPHWAGMLQALVLEHLPGPTLMSRDNLASMQVPNTAQRGVPGLESLGITPAALEPIARQYLGAHLAGAGLLGVRRRVRG